MPENRDLEISLEKAYGIFFDVNTWNGSSIFKMQDSGARTIITSEVAEAVKRAGLVGVQVTRLDRHGYEQWQQYQKTGKHPLLF